MRSTFFAMILALAFSGCARAQHQVIPIWDGKAPGSESWGNHETLSPDGKIVTNVSSPSMTVYFADPAKATGAAFVVCPGGGMRILSWETEGTRTAEWLNERGITAFILKYRTFPDEGAHDTTIKENKALPQVAELNEIVNGNANPERGNEEHNKIMNMAIADARQAIRIVREHSADWHVDPKRIGILGFSAGSGVAIGTTFGEQGEAYPSLLVALHGPSLIDVTVPKYAPSAFIAVGNGHPNVLKGSLALFSLWRAASRAAEFHVFDSSIELAGESEAWPVLALWLRRQGFMDAPPNAELSK